MDLCVVGAGHVGLVTAACFAELGNRVICVDQDAQKIRGLRQGKVWFYEPGLDSLVIRNMKRKRLLFSAQIAEAVRKSQVIFIAVGTPPLASGEADLTSVEQVVRQIIRAATGYRLIVEKSTVPVETGKRIQQILHNSAKKGERLEVASNPEFLREGSGVEDFFHPDRVVLGVESSRGRALLEELYKPFKAPLVITDIASAELIKHASNAFLASKISFINAVSVICDRVGADVEKVAEGMGMDPRIGRSFLRAGVGYGGFCFPKDLDAFIRIAEKLGYDFQLLKATRQINENQRKILIQKIEREMWNLKGKKVSLLGLAFKPDTDDLRFAPALEIIEALAKEGAVIRVFDPRAMGPARKLLGKRVEYCKDPYHLAQGADCLVMMTEWKDFEKLDFKKIKHLMRQAVIVDGRNMLKPEAMRKLGFRYTAMGRGLGS